MWLSIAAVVAVAILISVVLHIPTATIIIVPGLGLAVRQYMLSSTALMVGRAGVRVGDVGVPWESIAQMLVIRPQSANADIGIELLLRPDARVDHQQVGGLVRADKLNIERLRTKVNDFAPGVQVIERQGQPAGGPR